MKDLETWRRAGKVAAQALEYGRGIIRNGASIREACDRIDAKVIELGARPAWPTQVGLDGCIGDNATTIDLSGADTHIAKASQDALREAVKAVQRRPRPGRSAFLLDFGHEIPPRFHEATARRVLSGNPRNRA